MSQNKIFIAKKFDLFGGKLIARDSTKLRAQNSMRLSWTREEVDQKLPSIMKNIHSVAMKYGKEENGYINYVKGANIGGFVKVADAMLDQGVV
jgi:glutamate dehydrogenase/leucine dehydrogenase